MSTRGRWLVVMFGVGMVFVVGCTVYMQKTTYNSSIPVAKEKKSQLHASATGNASPVAVSVTARVIALRSLEAIKHSRIPLTDRVRLACGTFQDILKGPAPDAAARQRVLAYKTRLHLLFSGVVRDVLYCSIPKVANTSLKKLLLTLDESHNGRYTENTLHSYVKTALAVPQLLRHGKTSLSQVESAFKVMFVRHPFERLVSFFQDKGRRGTKTGNYYYRTYWNRLMKRLRGAREVDTLKSMLTFREFVHLLLETSPKQYDLHWQLYSDRCAPCTVQYDLVGTFDDLPDFYRLLGRDYTNWENKGPSNTANDTLYHFSQLSRSAVMSLYRVYFKDFLLFGYSVEPYLDVAQP
ncbi:carbohydrate sulfotransferase 8-like [Ornithodoros turicata]|uniref:carbohydrate sulfotransferase 8-like n=1 Tax=Ornithodoros turicata TaxID=34597 RepID=UPI003139CC28